MKKLHKVILISILILFFILIYISVNIKINQIFEEISAFFTPSNDTMCVDYEKKLNENEVLNYVKNKLKEKYNQTFNIELIYINEIILYTTPFPTASSIKKGTVKDAYTYYFKILDADGIIAYCYYQDAYYEGTKYIDAGFIDNYENIKEMSQIINRYEKVIYNYFDENELIRIEFDSSDTLRDGVFFNDDVYLKIYFNFNINNISAEHYAKSHNLSYDLNLLGGKITYEKSNGKYNGGPYIKVKGIFLDEPENSYDLYLIYGLGKKYIPSDYYNYDYNLISKEKQDIHKELYNYLLYTIKIDSEESKIISDAFLKYSQHYIYKINGISHKYNADINQYEITIKNVTRENNSLRIIITLVYDEEKNKYVGDDVRLMCGKAGLFLTVINYNKIH